MDHFGHPVRRLRLFIGVTFLFIDKTGHRDLLVWGAIGMAFRHFVVGGTMEVHHKFVPGGVGGNANIVISVMFGAPANTVIIFLYLLIVVYALTLAPVCWIFAACLCERPVEDLDHLRCVVYRRGGLFLAFLSRDVRQDAR